MESAISLTPRMARRYMQYLIASGFTWCFFSAVAIGPVFSGLLDALDLTDPQIGLVMSLGSLMLPLQLIGALVQQKYFRRKAFWLVCVLGYYLSFFVLALWIFLWQDLPATWAVALFLITYGIGQGSVQLSCSIQNAWVGDIVPERESVAFWNRRHGIVLVGNMIAALIAGWAVDKMGKDDRSTYVILLLVATVFGLLSSVWHFLCPDRDTRGDSRGSALEQIRSVWQNRSFRQLTFFFVFQQIAVCCCAGFYFIYPLKEMNLSMTSLQIMPVLCSLSGLAAAFVFRILGPRYGNKPILTICTSIKVGEFLLCAFWLPQIVWPDQIGNRVLGWISEVSGFAIPPVEAGFFTVLPAFLVAGFVNVGLVTSQMALITSTGKREQRSTAIGIFFTLLGLTGFVVLSCSGYVYKWLNECQFVQDSPFSAFHILALCSSFGIALSLLFLRKFKENGAAATGTVVKTLISGNPIRNVIQAHLLGQPIPEGSRIWKLQHVHTDLISSEVTQGLYSPSSRIRDVALLNISTMEHPIAPEVARELIRLLDIPGLGMQAMAARTLGRLRVEESLPALARHFRDPDLAIAQACIFAAGLIGDPSIQGELLPLLKDYRYWDRWTHTAEALSRLGNGDFRLVRAFFPVLNTESYGVLRQQTLISLSRLLMDDKDQAYLIFESESRIPGSEILKYLQEITTHPVWQMETDETKALLQKWNSLWEEDHIPECMEDILVKELVLFDISSADPKQPQAAFLSSLFGGSSMRNRKLEENTYVSISLWLQLKLWAELKYDSNDHDRFLLLTFLIAAKGFLRHLES